MAHNLFIDGAVGTTGLEIAERMAGRPEFTLIMLPEERRKEESARREALNDADFVILCLPDDAARQAVAMIDNDHTRVIDASSAHRVADGWTYGFAELEAGQKERIASASRVSNPGCYPTGFLGLVAPLVQRGLLPADWPYSVNAVSGYSGGGKALIARFDQDETDLAFRSYGLDLTHKHMPEMRRHAGLTHDVIFAPAVVPAYRGMLVEVPLNLTAMGIEARAADLQRALQDHYADSQIVHVLEGDQNELLLRRDEEPHDRLDLAVFANERGDQARLIAQLDNLGKGAAGSTVQDLNIMAGLDETAGLVL